MPFANVDKRIIKQNVHKASERQNDEFSILL